MIKHNSVISMILSVMILFSIFTSTYIVNAETNKPLFVVDTVSASEGQKNVAVNIAVKNNPGLASIALDIHYDKSALTLTDFEYNLTALGGAATVPFNPSSKLPCLSMVNGTSNINGDFIFATLYFDVADNASGSYDISISYDEDNIYNIKEENIPFEIIQGKIVVNEKDKPGIVVANVKVDSGTKNIPVTIALQNNPGIASIALDVSFDKSALTLTNFEYNLSALNGAATVPFNPNAKIPCLSVVNGTANINGDFILATLYFDVSTNAKGIYEINLTYDEDNIYNLKEENIPFEVNKGSITVEEKSTTTSTESTTYSTEPTTETTSTVIETEPTILTTGITTVSATEPTTSTVTETDPTTLTTTSSTVTTKPSTTVNTIPSTTPTITKPTVRKVTKVEVSNKSVTLLNGRSVTVKAKISPTNATNKKLKWATSNAKVATINQSGKITAKGRGTATIKVMALDGSNKYATVKVTVKQPVTSVKLNKKSANLKVKGNSKQKTVTLKATVYPKNANNKAVYWKSSNTRIATVNSKGKVIAKKKGTCYIIATAKDGSKKSSKCRIVVR